MHNEIGLLLEHERLHLEKEEMVNNGFHLPLVVLNWNLAFLRWCNRREYFNLHGDCNRNIDSLLLFKKNCGFTLKFAGKNIPLAIIQVKIKVFFVSKIIFQCYQ